jgi:DNA polymerase IV
MGVMEAPHTPGFCRDCLAAVSEVALRCPSCKGPRLARHQEIHDLSVAHIDCDAFYAAVEKRDRPELRDKSLIVGGGTRGVVSTACYIARIKGVKSAMPMFKALKLCPEAVVVRPNMRRYVEVGREVRELMLSMTPLVQPISIDEAFLDLSGTARVHGRTPALTLAYLLNTIESRFGITASAGLSYNKYLAKVASDQEKPRGFSVIGRSEATTFLAGKPVSLIWGVGKAFEAQLAKDGITKIGQLQEMDLRFLMKRYGEMGARLYHLSRGEDARDVSARDDSRGISSETTFNTDIADYGVLEKILWRQAERVSARAKAEQLAGMTVTLKLKTSAFKIMTRNATLDEATQFAHRIFSAAQPLLRREATGVKFRLLGVGISHLEPAPETEQVSLDARHETLTKAELAIDKLRKKFGAHAVEKGRSFTGGND